MTYLRCVPLDQPVVAIRFKPWSNASFTNAKEVGGGMFRAIVPATVTLEPTADDREPLDHTVVMDLDVIDSRLACTRCEISRRDNGPVVTSEAIRRVPVGRYLRAAMASGFVVKEVDPDDPDRLRDFVNPRRDFASAGMTDDVLKEVARLYYWCLVHGEPPLGVLERDYGIPRGKASRWIATARRRGYVKDEPDGS